MNNFLKKILPWVGAAATGNVPALVSMAASEIGRIVGKEVRADPSAIAEAVAGATPEQIVQLRQLDQDYHVRMAEMGFKNVEELERIEASDRASARGREIAVRDRTPALLALLVILGFFGVLTFMLLRAVPDEARDALMVMLGALGAAFMSVVAYYFGSSAGSARKDVILGDKINGHAAGA